MVIAGRVTICSDDRGCDAVRVLVSLYSIFSVKKFSPGLGATPLTSIYGAKSSVVKGSVKTYEEVVPVWNVTVLLTLPPKANTRLCWNRATPKLILESGSGATVIQCPVAYDHISEAFWASVPPPPVTKTSPSSRSTACKVKVVLGDCFKQNKLLWTRSRFGRNSNNKVAIYRHRSVWV